jgi:hypothetical protein
MWSALADAQQLGVALLAGSRRGGEADDKLRQVLERINRVTARLQA